MDSRIPSFVAAQMNGMSLPANCALCTLSSNCQISSGYLVKFGPGMCTHGRYQSVLIWLFYWMRKGEYWVLSRNLADSVSSPGLSNTPPDCLTPLQQGLVTACVGVKHLLSSSREETIDEKSSIFYILSVALNNCCKRRDSNKETNLGIRFLIRHWFKWLFFGWM